MTVVSGRIREEGLCSNQMKWDGNYKRPMKWSGGDITDAILSEKFFFINCILCSKSLLEAVLMSGHQGSEDRQFTILSSEYPAY